MRKSKLTERCALGHPKCSHTYGGKCYSVDLYVRAKLPTPTAAHVIEGNPGDIPESDRVDAMCHECGAKGFRIRSAYVGNELPPMFTIAESVVHTHVHRFDSGLHRWIIEEEPFT